MEWKPVLFGCFGSWNRDGGWDVMTPDAAGVPYRVHYNVDDLVQGDWLLGAGEKAAFFGHWGEVGDFLGWDHKGARDGSGRKLDFFLGYVAAERAHLPTADDLEGLRDQIRKDLLRLGEASWEAQGQLLNVPAVTLPEFSAPRNPQTEWDRAVVLLNAGKPSPLVVRGRSGERVIPLSSPGSPGSPPSALAKLAERFAKGGSDAGEAAAKKNIRPGKLGFIKVTMVSLVAIAVGYLGWRALNNSQNPTRSSSTETSGPQK